MIMDRERIVKRGREVLEIEAKGILALTDRLDENFVQAVEFLYK